MAPILPIHSYRSRRAFDLDWSPSICLICCSTESIDSLFNQANTNSVSHRFFSVDIGIAYRNFNKMPSQIVDGCFFAAAAAALTRTNLGCLKCEDFTMNTCYQFFSRLSLRFVKKEQRKNELSTFQRLFSSLYFSRFFPWMKSTISHLNHFN